MTVVECFKPAAWHLMGDTVYHSSGCRTVANIERKMVIFVEIEKCVITYRLEFLMQLNLVKAGLKTSTM